MNQVQPAHIADLSALLTAGGDERIWPEPATGRNRYGVGPFPAPDEIWLSSSTASAVSVDGFKSAQSALRGLIADDGDGHRLAEALFEDIRRRLLALYGAPGSEAVLVPSGTEGELMVSVLARTLMPGPLTNIVTAPSETGSGVFMAAGGASFLDSASLGGRVRKGDRLPGMREVDIEARAVEIRDASGGPREPCEIDSDVARIAHEAVAAGRNVIVHVLDTSKTGLSGLSRRAAVDLARDLPGRVLVVVDACQLRCPSAELRQDLARGFLTIVTGSKFAAGPPFSGALFIPAEIVDRLGRTRIDVDGLGRFSALDDWPARLRQSAAVSLAQRTNLGLGLRWIAALESLDRFEAIPMPVRVAIAARFEAESRSRIERAMAVAPLERHAGIADCSTIVPFVLLDRDGAALDAASTARVHALLRDAPGGPVIHVGQPVALGRRNVLRICASARHFVDIAGRYAAGGDFEAAFAPLSHDLDVLFHKLDGILATGGRRE